MNGIPIPLLLIFKLNNSFSKLTPYYLLCVRYLIIISNIIIPIPYLILYRICQLDYTLRNTPVFSDEYLLVVLSSTFMWSWNGSLSRGNSDQIFIRFQFKFNYKYSYQPYGPITMLCKVNSFDPKEAIKPQWGRRAENNHLIQVLPNYLP